MTGLPVLESIGDDACVFPLFGKSDGAEVQQLVATPVLEVVTPGSSYQCVEKWLAK